MDNQIHPTAIIDKSTKFIGKNIPTNENEYESVYLQEIDDIDRVEVTNI